MRTATPFAASVYAVVIAHEETRFLTTDELTGQRRIETPHGVFDAVEFRSVFGAGPPHVLPDVAVEIEQRGQDVDEYVAKLTAEQVNAPDFGAINPDDLQCPICGGELDTGGECNDCGFDTRPPCV